MRSKGGVGLMRSNEGVGLMRWINANNGVYGPDNASDFHLSRGQLSWSRQMTDYLSIYSGVGGLLKRIVSVPHGY